MNFFMLLSLTLALYGVFPLVFAIIRKKPITQAKYFIICFVFNFILHLLLIAISSSIYDTPHSPSAAYAIWTCVFTGIGDRILKKKCLLGGAKESVPAETAILEKQTEEYFITYVDPTKIKDGNISVAAIAERPRYCRRCGRKLEFDSVYCHRCGTKVVEIPQEAE